MLDIKWIRQNAERFDKAMQDRSSDIRSEDLLQIDDNRRVKIEEIQNFQNQRNDLAKKIAIAKKNGENADDLMNLSKEVNAKLSDNYNEFEEKLKNILISLPNIPESEVPFGKGEDDNVEVEKWGVPKEFNFKPKEHFEIGENLKMLDFDQSSVISGARFSTLSADLAKLERVLSNFMLDIAIDNGYMEVSPPNLVRDNAMFGSGQLPKFAEEAFKTTNDYWLIPTAEVSLVNLVQDKILSEEQLPLRFTAYTPCFRSEAGSAGKDTRGMVRQHQFKKVELVSIVSEEESLKEHERMTNIAMEILQKLKIPYRKMLLCSGDMGFSAQKTYDLEVWLPGQGKYREISSCSNCGDFQARRMNAKYRSPNAKKPIFIHSLNGSSLAVGRTIIAILENYQNEDGTVTVPEILVEAMGKKIIKQ
ncbi:serine--tRNA ligase [Rickettsiales bacterium]|nr:serine--tRNA ligase [Rickettsiales bacterium]MDB2550807.1 serine--tRNA ligase [Rickettsiales bacterium]